MLGATSSQQQGTANEQTPSTSTTYSCNLCQVTFQNGLDQRTHMKEPWHVYNLKQRVASLPAVTLSEFESVEKKTESSKVFRSSKSAHYHRPRPTISSDDDEKDHEVQSDPESESDTIADQSTWPYLCLFCTQSFPLDAAGLSTNLAHMHSTHGLFIPNAELVLDMASFIGYLATEIRAWHECLYCGATKSSTFSIQSHMRDKGHCLLNLDREPELLEFWEGVGEEGGAALDVDLDAEEIILSSGRVIGSRSAAPAIKRAARKRDLAVRALQAGPEDPEISENAQAAEGIESAELSEVVLKPQLSSSRQLARREEMGMVGVSPQQRQALVLAEKKAQRSEAIARRAREWVYAKGANLQKYDQVDTKMKMGKQNHKLQPR